MHPHSVRFPILSILIVVLFACTASAGPVGGRVVDPDGRPVPGASILLIRGAAVVSTGETDSSGAFALRTPDEGRFELRVALDGFRARPIEVTGRADSLDVGTIALTISAVSESVLVSAAQVDVPLSTAASSATVMTGEELLARQLENVSDVLRLVPGMTVVSTGGRGAVTGVFPRGGESDYTLVVVDGVQANAFGGGFDFGHLPLVNVERIEVVRGPQSALYGSNAIGAVVRVVTKHGGPPSAQASFEGGSLETTRLTAATSGTRGGWRWDASAERLASEGMNGQLAPSGERVENDDYSRRELSAGAGWTWSGGAGLRGDVQYITDERGFPGPFGTSPSGTPPPIDTVSRGSDERWLSSVSATMPMSGRVRTLAQATHSRIDSRFASPFGASDSFSRRTTARMQADVTWRSGLDGSAGVEIQREEAGSTFITAADFREVPVERSLAGVFGEARWNLDTRLFVTAGLRVEWIVRDALAGDPAAFAPRPPFGRDTIVSANPKIAAAWYVRTADGESTKVRASAGTGIRAPDAFEIAFTDNPSLEPERSRSLDAGIDHAAFGGRALVEVTAFFNHFDDLIVAVGSFRESSRYRTDNISNARARGLELAGTLRGRLGTRSADVRLRTSYTFLDTEILEVDGGTGAPPPFAAGDALLRRPRHQFAVDLFIQAGRLSGYVLGGGRSRTRDVEPVLGTFGGVFDASGYAVWNAGVSLKATRRLDLFARVTNLFDRDYEEALGYPAPGRGVLAGLRVAASH
ncbi:MAG TPA: TonB-dependent receptor [Vicinamibacterales bacterium]|nr:TonB-dependent receptor [Vicinamibacterales bacterium]